MKAYGTYLIDMEKNTRSITPIIFAGIFLLIAAAAFYFIMGNREAVVSDETMPDFSEGQSIGFTVVGTPFSTKYPKDIRYHPKDSIPWGQQLPKNDAEIGVLGAFTLQGRDLSIRQPYMQLGYVWRGNKAVSTPDSAMHQTEKFIKTAAESKILTARNKQRTQSGSEFIAEEFEWGKRAFEGGTIEKKYVAYAFLPLNQDYILSYTLTARNEEDFKNLLPSFYYIVKGSK
jgi:hypothetical protein